MTKATPVISKNTLITVLDDLDDLMEGLKCSACSTDEWNSIYNAYVELDNYFKTMYGNDKSYRKYKEK